MKYKLIRTDYGIESMTDADGNYSISITLGLIHLEGLQQGQGLSHDLKVVSNNSQTGQEVDEQREKVIADFCEGNEVLIHEEKQQELSVLKDIIYKIER